MDTYLRCIQLSIGIGYVSMYPKYPCLIADGDLGLSNFLYVAILVAHRTTLLCPVHTLCLEHCRKIRKPAVRDPDPHPKIELQSHYPNCRPILMSEHRTYIHRLS
jgi:hypothetical protein